jgi:hypothetical protein
MSNTPKDAKFLNEDDCGGFASSRSVQALCHCRGRCMTGALPVALDVNGNPPPKYKILLPGLSPSWYRSV